MFGVTTSDDYKPVAWMGRWPVDVTTILVGFHVVCMVAACLLTGFGAAGFLDWLKFDSTYVLQGWGVHQIVTYAFVQRPAEIIWFAIQMYMLYVFGREVEQFIGRKAFIGLYAVLLLAPSLLLTVWGLFQPVAMAGSSVLHFAIFIAFATIYPRVELFLRLQTLWLAVILVAAYTLQLLAFNVWHQLAVLWLNIAAAFFFVRLRGVGPELVWWTNLKSSFQPKPKFKVVPRATERRVVEPENVHESIDPILEKISKLGVGSLTASERRILDRARNRLLKNTK